MVDVEYGEAEVRREFAEDVEEADGIFPTGDCDAGSVSGEKHVVAVDGGGDALEEGGQLISLYGWSAVSSQVSGTGYEIAAQSNAGKKDLHGARWQCILAQTELVGLKGVSC
jgi:hypothetical protein